MATYKPRALTPRVLESTIAPVIILEGARAVGKSTLLTHEPLSSAYASYSTLADDTTLGLARLNPQRWLADLPNPAIIDEAQLLPDIEIDLKQIVDEAMGEKRYLLTGSAAIRSQGFGSQRPLTHRSIRLRLHPFTALELHGDPANLAEALLLAEPIPGPVEPLKDAEALQAMTRGGFPRIALDMREASARAIHRVLSNDLSPELLQQLKSSPTLDHYTAHRVLLELLRNPAGIVNDTKLGSKLSIDRRTVAKYLAELERYFYVWPLFNYANRRKKRPDANPKMHPVDASLSVAVLQFTEPDIDDHRELFGALVESYVVNQCAIAAEMSELDMAAYYWRDATKGGRKVDLVLSSQRYGDIAVEVKASRRVGARDIRGIEEFRRQNSATFRRGYVFYMGDTIEQLADDVWALPLRTLMTSQYFDGLETLPGHAPDPARVPAFAPHPESTPVPAPDSDISIFFSYTHRDNDALGGVLVAFAHAVREEYAVQTGDEINLFIDRDDIEWGQNWAARLDAETSTRTFLMSAVTPLYLKSDACRHEVTSFLAAERRHGAMHSGLLPLLTVPLPARLQSPDDPVAAAFAAHQYLDLTGLRDTQAGDQDFDRLVRSVTERLARVVELLDQGGEPARPAAGASEPDVATVLSRLEERGTTFRAEFDAFQAALGVAMTSAGAMQDIDLSNPRLLPARMVQFAQTIKPHVSELRAQTTHTREAWGALSDDLRVFTSFSRDTLDAALVRDMAASLAGFDGGAALSDGRGLLEILNNMTRFSKAIGPLRDSVREALNVLQHIDHDVREWRRTLEARGR